jgi:uncharacterized membrane protein YdfJ with MMPL/SSD domain
LPSSRRRGGQSITASAAAVAGALLTVLAASFGLCHDLGLPLAAGMAVMLLAGLTLVPALLAILGRAVFSPAKTRPRDHFEGVRGKIAARLVRRPVRTLGAGAVVLGALPLFALGFKPSGSLGMSQHRSADEMPEHLGEAGLELLRSVNVVRGFAEYYRQQDKPPAAHLDRMLRRVADEAARMETLIEGLGARSPRGPTGPALRPARHTAGSDHPASRHAE